MVGPVERPFRAGVLGATGIVGQRLVLRLHDHPWFDLTAVAASDRSAGRPYQEAARWSLAEECPGVNPSVRRCLPDEHGDCDVVFSALDASTAREIEPRFAQAGLAVVSNSSAHRQDPDVPLLIPEVNAAHLGLLEVQRGRTGAGYIVTNPNCSAIGLVLALAPLDRAFGVRRVVVTTMQALSGAGVDGPRGLEMVDNVLPWIPGEEEKLPQETQKILGEFRGDRIEPAVARVSPHCHRVGTIDGHLEAVSVELDREVDPAEAADAMKRFRGDTEGLDLPSSPAAPIVVRSENDRPQPRLDRDAGGGMSVVVGRLRPCPVLTLRFDLLVHNAERGAAGAAVLNAELLAARGLLPRRDGR
ncbi:MAG: aspartate-semialdehyde dehydrogenase [Acidobacteriota bacterium]|nr:aspartate-semialdehyde dehydrogenase [Acidobacteriota bacterium]